MKIFRAGWPIVVMLAMVMALSTGCKKKTPEERLRDAQAMMSQNQGPVAVLKLKDLLNENPPDQIVVEANLTLAQIFARNPQTMPTAIDHLDKAYNAMAPDDADRFPVLRQMVMAMVGSGKEAAALAKLDGAIAATADPELKEHTEILRGMVQLGSQDEAVADAAFVELSGLMTRTIVPENRHILRNTLAEYSKSKQRWQEANNVFQMFIDTYPDDPTNGMNRIAMAVNYRQLGDEDKANQIFDEGVAMWKARIDQEAIAEVKAEMLNQLAIAYRSAKRTDDSVATLREIMTENPNSEIATDAHFGIASEYAYAGREEEAIATLREIMAANPRTQAAIRAQFNIGNVLMSAGKNDEAMAHFQQMAKENPESPIERQALESIEMIRLAPGEEMMSKGQFDEALAFFNKMKAENQDTPLGEKAANAADFIVNRREALDAEFAERNVVPEATPEAK